MKYPKCGCGGCGLCKKRERYRQYYWRHRDKYLTAQAERRARPEVREKMLERARERNRAKRQTEEYKEWVFHYRRRPEVKAKIDAYQAEYRNRPEVKERRKVYGHEYRQRPEVKRYNLCRHGRELEAARAARAAAEQARAEALRPPPLPWES